MSDTNRKLFLFTDAEIIAANSLFPEHVTIKNATLAGAKGFLIDSKMVDCHISTTDGSPVFISALAKLENCKVEAGDVLIEGYFSGSIAATGKVELGAGCTMAGTLTKGGAVFLHPEADFEELVIKSLKSSPSKSAVPPERSAPEHVSDAVAPEVVKQPVERTERPKLTPPMGGQGQGTPMQQPMHQRDRTNPPHSA